MNLLWPALIIITIVRLAVASLGHYGETEAYFMLCAQHLDWGFVEGPAGVPALIKLGSIFSETSLLGVRFFSPLMMFIASWMLWRLTRSLFQEEKKTAYWSVIAFNLLPLANTASVVMDGTMIITSFWIIAVHSSWRLLSPEREKFEMIQWIFFGLLLAVATQFSYAIGWFLPVVCIWIFLIRGFQWKSSLGAGIAFLLLLLGWLGPLWWNTHHDMIQWSSITWGSFWSWEAPSLDKFTTSPVLWFMPLLIPFFLLGLFFFTTRHCGKRKNISFLLLVLVPLIFYIGALGHHQSGLPLLLAIIALLLPGTVCFFLKNTLMKKTGIGILSLSAIFSLALMSRFFSPSANTSWSIPSPRGITGVQQVAVELLRLRTINADSSGHTAFIIAATPGLAALIGMSLPITYPEIEGAPSVFIPESPALTSQFHYWPHYADATTKATSDPLYTEEQASSPFLTKNALYIAPAAQKDLPETMLRSFASITPLTQITLKCDNQELPLLIYLCQDYQMMSL